MIPIGLAEALSGIGVRILILDGEAFRIPSLIPADFVIGRQNNRVINRIQPVRPVNSPVYKGNIPHRKAGGQRVRDFRDGPLPHSVGDQIRLGIQKQGTLYPVGPIVIMGQTAQAGLDPSRNDRDVRINRPDQIAVNHAGIIRPLSHYASGRIGVLFPPPFGYGIVVHHGIHISCAHQKSQPRPSKGHNTLLLFPIRLRDDPHPIASGFQ